MGRYKKLIIEKSGFERLQFHFLRNPNRIYAAKVVLAMTLLITPFVLFGKAYFGITLALGTLAAALAETDDHPKGRIKALLLTLVSFAITTCSVMLLRPFSYVFVVGLVVSTFVFVFIGGMGERYRGISFGAILIGIYAMLGYHHAPHWYYSPVLLCSGALFYGMISVGLSFIKPRRLLDEQLARGFKALAKYLDEKSNLFPGEEGIENRIGLSLAKLNVEVVNSLEKCKAVINSYSQEEKDQQVLLPYLQRFMLLQSLHERAASSQERYEKLGKVDQYKQVLEGFGELLHQLSHAIKLVADSLLTGLPYQHPVGIVWIINALESEILKMEEKDQQMLTLLLHNLTRSHDSLLHLNDVEKSTSIPRLGMDQRTLWQRIKEQLNWNHPRFKYAIRLSACFVIGLGIVDYFQLEKGEWIMLTALLVNQPTYSETRRRLMQRVMGTVLGVVVGIGIVLLMPTQIGQIVLMLMAGYWFFYFRLSNYSYAVVFITIFVLCNNNLQDNSGIEKMLPRIVDTVTGALLAILSIRFLWPDWQKTRLPKLLVTALNNNGNYFSQVLKAYRVDKGAVDDYDYRLARRRAHQADNDLSVSWSSMRIEPKRHQRLMGHAFTLTYLNHALLSYLSAFGARRDTYTIDYEGFDEVASKIEKALRKAGQNIEGQQAESEDWNLKSTLVALKDRLKSTEDQTEKQQLRLLYNIAGVSNKLLKESVLLNEK